MIFASISIDKRFIELCPSVCIESCILAESDSHIGSMSQGVILRVQLQMFCYTASTEQLQHLKRKQSKRKRKIEVITELTLDSCRAA